MTRTSKATRQACYSMSGPFAVAQGFLFVMLIVFAVFQPAVDRPDTYPCPARMFRSPFPSWTQCPNDFRRARIAAWMRMSCRQGKS